MKDYYAEILSGDYIFDFEKFDSFSAGDIILKGIIPPIIKSESVDIKQSVFKGKNDHAFIFCTRKNKTLDFQGL
jgi:hypothetical protein